jgi:Fe2+ transport system protein FeoA
LLPATEIRLVRRAPLGDPIEVEILGYRLSLRRSDAAAVWIEALSP